jgi:predicted Zn-dependent protease
LLARVLIAGVAVLVLAWLALGMRSLGQFERAERLAARADATPAEAEEIERLLEGARLLNPDTRPLLVQGAFLAGRRGERARGVAILERAVRLEPENVVAWGVLAEATDHLDPRRSRVARARVAQLSPPVAAR